MTVISANVTVDMSGLFKYQKAVDAQLISGSSGPVHDALKKWAWRYRSFVQLRFDSYSKGGGNWKPLARTTVAMRRKKGGGTHGDTFKKIDAIVAKKRELENKQIGRPRKVGKGKVAVKKTKTGTTRRKKLTVKNVFKSLTKKAKAFKKGSSKGFKALKAEYKRQVGNSALRGKRNANLGKLQAQIDRLHKSIRVTILRNLGILFQALAPTFTSSPGALELGIPFGIRVGYGGPATHPGSKLSVADIAAIHDQGLGHVPQRQIIVPPPDTVLSAMAKDMKLGLKRQADLDT